MGKGILNEFTKGNKRKKIYNVCIFNAETGNIIFQQQYFRKVFEPTASSPTSPLEQPPEKWHSEEEEEEKVVRGKREEGEGRGE